MVAVSMERRISTGASKRSSGPPSASSRTALASAYQGQATAMYPDPLGFDEIAFGEASDRVRTLQLTLLESGHLAGAVNGEFDAAIAMYHDQGLIPIKLLDPHHAVNVTIGIPIAYDEAIQNCCFVIANTRDHRIAVFLSCGMILKISVIGHDVWIQSYVVGVQVTIQNG